MNRMRVKLIVGGLAILAAVALLATASVREGWVYSLSVDEFRNSEKYHDQRVRLEGTVADEILDSAGGLLHAEFDLLGETGRIRVEYSGVIPDMFKPGHVVVVEGRMSESGVFRADALMTKCASKYESDAGEAPPADHPKIVEP